MIRTHLGDISAVVSWDDLEGHSTPLPCHRSITIVGCISNVPHPNVIDGCPADSHLVVVAGEPKWSEADVRCDMTAIRECDYARHGPRACWVPQRLEYSRSIGHTVLAHKSDVPNINCPISSSRINLPAIV